jgi:uncharacterized protein
MTQNLEEFDIHIASDGRWFHQGGEIKRPAIIKLFASVLSRDDNGRYWLTTPVEKGEVTVEDAPFIIIGLKSIHDVGEENPRLEMVDNVDRDFILGSYHPVFFKKDEKQRQTPYLRLNDGLTAKITRPVYYQLMDMVTHNSKGEIGVWSADEFIVLQT